MALQLVVDNILPVRVKGLIPGVKNNTAFNFTLLMNRMTSDEYRTVMSPESGTTVADVLIDNARGWEGQQLVLEEGGNPAEFTPEAFKLLISVVAVEQAAFSAYVAALQDSRTPKGRSGN